MEQEEEQAADDETLPLDGDAAPLEEGEGMEENGTAAESEPTVTAESTSEKAATETAAESTPQGEGKGKGRARRRGPREEAEEVPENFHFNLSEAEEFIENVCKAVSLEPSKQANEEKGLTWVRFPPHEQFESLVKREWKYVGKKFSMPGHRRRLYPFPKDWAKRWEVVPTVDNGITNLVLDFTTPAQGKVIPKNSLERRIDLAAQKAFIISGQLISAASATSYVTQALKTWLDQFSTALPDELKAHKNLPLVQASANYLSDASQNLLKSAARASASQVVARRAVWLSNVDTKGEQKQSFLNLPFKGSLLFGGGAGKLLKEVKAGMRRQAQNAFRGQLGLRGLRGPVRGPRGAFRGYRVGLRGSLGGGGYRGGTARGRALSFSAKFAAIRTQTVGRGRGRGSRRGGR